MMALTIRLMNTGEMGFPKISVGLRCSAEGAQIDFSDKNSRIFAFHFLKII